MDHGLARPLFRIAVTCLTALACAGASPARDDSRVVRAPLGEEPGQPFDAPLGEPLAPPLDVTGGFCEFRVGHFHAGLDLGTGQRVGKPLLAPADGHVARVRTSGVGYGRSIYLLTDDGRLLQFGHLDAFAEPLGSYVRQVQDSSGQYEQDLYPAANRFRFRQGETMAWTGESGAGGPHLHFEVRRGDMAYHPFRAGLATADSSPPTLASLTLEPLDESSHVEGGATPYTQRLTARPETLRVRGRMRAIVGARDGVWQGVDRMVPWSVGLEWEGKRVECRFDSVSWADDMVESDYVFDNGRVVGDKGILLWAPAGYRPRVILADAPAAEAAGTIEVRPGDPARALRLWARDLGGNRTERLVTLLPAATGLDTAGALPKPSTGALEFASLPGYRLRVTNPGSRRALVVAASRWLETSTMKAARLTPKDSVTLEAHSYRVHVPAGAVFEEGMVLLGEGAPAEGGGELTAVSVPLVAEPAQVPLRRALRIAVPAPVSVTPRNTAFYRNSGDGWDWIGGSFDARRSEFVAESRRLGRFALMTDTLAPRVTLRRPPKTAAVKPYSRWALTASVREGGSGVDARASYFVVDGRRRPSEWDSEADLLRWRPARKPAKGRHRVEVVVADRAGNLRRSSGAFVLD